MKCRLLYGLPTSTFDISILFNNTTSTFQRRLGFPSYSWSGWKGRVYWDVQDTNWYSDPLDSIRKDWLASNTWTIWYERPPSGPPKLLWDSEDRKKLGK